MTRFWVCALSDDEAVRGGLATSRVPHAGNVAPQVLTLCMNARTSIGAALMYVTTQLPFSYTHLLALLVKFAQLVNAVYLGSHTGLLLSAPVCLDHATMPTGHTPRYSPPPGCPMAITVYSYWAVTMIVLGWVVQVAAYPLIYNGLLSIGVGLENPLQNDFISLPELAYQHFANDECKAFHTGIGAIDRDAGWWPGLNDERAPPPDSPAEPPVPPPMQPAPSESSSHGAGTCTIPAVPTPADLWRVTEALKDAPADE